MALTVQKHLPGAYNSVFEAHNTVRVFPINRNTSTEERNEQKIHATGSTTFGVSRPRQSTRKLECVRMFRLLRNIHTPGLNELEIAGVVSVQRDPWLFALTLIRRESRLHIWQKLCRNTQKIHSTNTGYATCGRDLTTLVD